jgi:hypothetical protein
MRDALRRRWPDAVRLDVAFRLARDVDAATDLLAGRAVDPARLDPDELVQARTLRLVRLAAPVDLVGFDLPPDGRPA